MQVSFSFELLFYPFYDMKRKTEIKPYNRIHRTEDSLFGPTCRKVPDRQFLCIQHNPESGLDMYRSRCE